MPSFRITYFLVILSMCNFLRAVFVAIALVFLLYRTSRLPPTAARGERVRNLLIAGLVLSVTDWIPTYIYLKSVWKRNRGIFITLLAAACTAVQLGLSAAIVGFFEKDADRVQRIYLLPSGLQVGRVIFSLSLLIAIFHVGVNLAGYLAVRNAPVRFKLPWDYEPVLQGIAPCPAWAGDGEGPLGVLSAAFNVQQSGHSLPSESSTSDHPNLSAAVASDAFRDSGTAQNTDASNAQGKQSAEPVPVPLLAAAAAKRTPLENGQRTGPAAHWRPSVVYWGAFPAALQLGFRMLHIICAADVVCTIFLFGFRKVNISDWPTQLRLVHPIVWAIWVALLRLLQVRRVPFERRIVWKVTAEHCLQISLLFVWMVWASYSAGALFMVAKGVLLGPILSCFCGILLVLVCLLVVLGWVSKAVSGSWAWIPRLSITQLFKEDENMNLVRIDLGWEGRHPYYQYYRT